MFPKSPQISNFVNIRSLGAEGFRGVRKNREAEGRTNNVKLIFSFRKSPKVPKTDLKVRILTH
jgi:hypothetical protein